MRTRCAADVGPYIAVVQQFQNTLAVRADHLLVWRERPSQGLIADIPEGKLLLTPFSTFWKLTVIFEGETPANTDGLAPGKVELGRRQIDVGSAGRLQRVAMELVQRGVPGGPTVTHGPDGQWIPGARRMMLPAGELRLSDAAEGPCTLTFEDGNGVELLGKGSRDEMERQALTRWEMRLARPLQLIVEGRLVKLRSIDVAGVLGYHALADNRFIALVQAGDELALVFIHGLYPYLLTRVSWDEALTGEAFDVDALLDAPSPANHGPSANDVPGLLDARKPTYEPSTAAIHAPEAARDVAQPSAGPRASAPPDPTPMSRYHRALCRWYLERLHDRLKGRGARKARALALRIREALDLCRVDITGTRIEVHAELVRLLGAPTLPGGDRNIRDALDLLASQAHFVHREEAGTRCTLVLSQFHDPDSVLMRSIAAEKAAADVATEVATSDEVTLGLQPLETDAVPPGVEAPLQAIKVHVPGPMGTESAPESPTSARVVAAPPVLETVDAPRPAAPPSSAPMNLTAWLSHSEPSVAEIEPASGDSATPATKLPAAAPVDRDSELKLEPSEHVAPMDEPQTCSIVWSAFASCERASSLAEVQPSVLEPPEEDTCGASSGLSPDLPISPSKPEVSLIGFARHPFPGES